MQHFLQCEIEKSVVQFLPTENQSFVYVFGEYSKPVKIQQIEFCKHFKMCEFCDKGVGFATIYYKAKLYFITYVKQCSLFSFLKWQENCIVPLIGFMQWKSDLQQMFEKLPAQHDQPTRQFSPCYLTGLSCFNNMPKKCLNAF